MVQQMAKLKRHTGSSLSAKLDAAESLLDEGVLAQLGGKHILFSEALIGWEYC